MVVGVTSLKMFPEDVTGWKGSVPEGQGTAVGNIFCANCDFAHKWDMKELKFWDATSSISRGGAQMGYFAEDCLLAMF